MVLLLLDKWCTPPPHSGFKFQIVALFLIPEMSLVELFFFCRESIESFHGIVYR
jgi:hypothetical protein